MQETNQGIAQPWLANFERSDRAVAALLLDNFIYYSSRATDRLLVAAFETLTRTPPSSPRYRAPDFLDAAIFTLVRGETEKITDSGFYVSRRVRQVLEIDDSRFLSTSAALAAARSGAPVVFLDDFAGSGDQFVKTWATSFDGLPSFATVHAASPFPCVYVNIFSTRDAANRIQFHTPVHVHAAHILDVSYTYMGLPARQPTPHFDQPVPRVSDLLTRYAQRLEFLGDDAYMTHDPDWRVLGYRNQGLLVGFEHSIPDGTLPLLWATSRAGWAPLVKRT
jgi:hypothetical protein